MIVAINHAENCLGNVGRNLITWNFSVDWYILNEIKGLLESNLDTLLITEKTVLGHWEQLDFTAWGKVNGI